MCSQYDGNGGAAAESDQRIKGGNGSKYRPGQGNSGHLNCVSGTANEEYISHVVDDIHGHDQNYRQRHGQKKFGYGSFSQFFFIIHSSSSHFLCIEDKLQSD